VQLHLREDGANGEEEHGEEEHVEEEEEEGEHGAEIDGGI